MTRKIIFSLAAIICAACAYGQSVQNSPFIQTGVPFLNISPDARAGAMADVGAATSPDASSAHWNPAKYAFTETNSGFSLHYTPWLNNLSKDMFLGYVTYYHHLNEKSALSASFRYFNMGKIEKTDISGSDIVDMGTFSPNELAFDVSYSMALGERFSLALTLRYIYSKINDGADPSAPDVKPGHDVAADLSGFYNSRLFNHKGLDTRWRFGFNISNVGPAIRYTSQNEIANKLPTNLRLGGGCDLIFDPKNSLSLALETNKLLVPSPQKTENGYITPEDMGLLEGMGDALFNMQNGVGDKLAEYTLALGAEYSFKDLLMLRAGYHYQNPLAGNDRYLTFGAGLHYKSVGIDFSYLLPANSKNVKSPYANTIRLSLTFNFSKK